MVLLSLSPAACPNSAMKNFLVSVSLLIAGLLLVSCSSNPVEEPDAHAQLDLSDQPVEIQIISMSEWTSHIDPVNGKIAGESVPSGGAAVLAAYWDIDRAAYPGATMVIATGDSFGTSPPLASFFNEEPAIVALNLMGLDIDTFGNHNFDQGLEHLQAMIDLAEWDYLAANLTRVPQNLRNVAPYTVRNVGGVPIAFIGVIDPAAPTLVFPGSFGTMDVTAPVPAILEAWQMAQDSGATAFVVLAHLWSETTPEGGLKGPILDLAGALHRAGMSDHGVIIGEAATSPLICTVGEAASCSLSPQDEAVTLMNPATDGALIVQNREQGKTYARIFLNIVPSTGVVLDRRVEFVVPVVESVKPKESIEAALADYRTRLDEAKSEPVCLVTGTFDVVTQDIRSREVAAGNLIADMIFEYGSSPDVAIINSGGIRSSLPSPDYIPQDSTLSRPPGGTPWNLLRGDVEAMLPFVNFVVELDITGADLWSTIEHSVAVSTTPDAGPFLQISGLRYWFDLDRPEGDRVCHIELEDGTVVEKDAKRFRLATIDFLAQGGDGYVALPNSEGFTRDLLTDVIISQLRKRETISPEDFFDPERMRINDVTGVTNGCTF